MYATPTLRPVSAAAGACTCCTITMGDTTVRDDRECSARGFPTCEIAFPGIDLDICTVTVPTPLGPLTVSG